MAQSDSQFAVAVKFVGGETLQQIVDKTELVRQLTGFAESDWQAGDMITVVCVRG